MELVQAPRVLCLSLPHFRVQCELRRRRLTQAPERSDLILYRRGQRPIVVDASREVAKQGVGRGLWLSRAQSYAPQALALPEDVALYEQEGQRLIQALLSLTPEVGSSDLDAVYLGVRGLETLIGDERAVAERARSLVGEVGYAARAVTASHRYAALLLAQHGPQEHGVCWIVPREQEEAMIKALPLTVLPKQPPEAQGKLARSGAAWREMLRRLKLMGMRRLGDLLDLGKVALQAQFGAVGLHLWRLLAGETLPLDSATPWQEIAVHRQFDPPLENGQALEGVLEQLCQALLDQLRQGGYACTQLAVQWQPLSRGLKAATRGEEVLALKSGDRVQMQRAARRCLQAVQQPLEEIALRAQGYAPEEGQQLSLFATQAERNGPLEHLADDLAERYGRPTLWRAEFVSSHPLEERRYRLKAI